MLELIIEQFEACGIPMGCVMLQVEDQPYCLTSRISHTISLWVCKDLRVLGFDLFFLHKSNIFYLIRYVFMSMYIYIYMYVERDRQRERERERKREKREGERLFPGKALWGRTFRVIQRCVPPCKRNVVTANLFEMQEHLSNRVVEMRFPSVQTLTMSRTAPGMAHLMPRFCWNIPFFRQSLSLLH